MPIRLTRLVLLLLLLLLAGCVHRPAPDVRTSLSWGGSGQLVLVTVPDWDSNHGSLRRYNRDASGHWSAAAPAQTVVVGRSGIAWGSGLHPPQTDGPVKREGDGRSPAGVFAIGEAFGYAASAETALPYAAMTARDYCIDVSASPLYNRIVDAGKVGADAVAGSTEPMRRDLHENGDQRYRLGFVIEHNAVATPAGGSCIFAHVWKSPDSATAGCTAMPDAVMERILAWLDPAEHPVFVLLPQAEYIRLQQDWQLPSGQGQP